MTRRLRRSTDRPHRRFSSWLVAAPSGDPPRELAVHAASCPECQRIVAAMDELASVDLGLAGLPEAPATPGRFAWLIVTRRAAMAGASLAAFAAVAFIGWRFFLAPEETLLGANTLPSPTQAVQGGVGSPQPSVFPASAGRLCPGHLAPVRRAVLAPRRLRHRPWAAGSRRAAPLRPPDQRAFCERATRHNPTADVRRQALRAGDTAAPAATHTQADAGPAATDAGAHTASAAAHA